MSYDHKIKGHLAKLRVYWAPDTLLPLQVFFKTTESDWPTLCGDGGHRTYRGRYCLTDPHKGKIQVDLNNEIGFLEKETLFGWLDTSDGHFKIKVPLGGLPLEPCAVTVSNFITGRKYGVRFTGDPARLSAVILALDGCGVALWHNETKTFVWAGIDDAGSFKDGGQFGSELWGMDFSTYLLRSQYDPNLLYTTQSVLTGGGNLVWTHSIETWTPSGTTLSHNVESETGTKVILGWQNTGYADPPVPDTTRPDEYVVTGILTPWFHAAGYSWRHVSWKQGGQQLTYSGYQCSNGRVYGTFLQSPSLPEHYYSSTLIQGFGYRPESSPLSNLMERTVAWEVLPADIHPGCDIVNVAAQCKDYFVIHATDSATYTLHYYAIIRKSDGGILHVHNWAEYPHLSVPTSAGVLSGIAWLFCRDILNDKEAAFNMQSGQWQQYSYWRDVYRWNAPPGPPSRYGGMVPKADGQLGWGFHYTNHPETVFRGDVCLIGEVDDFYLVVGECGPTEDLSSGCPEGHHKARARFTIKSLPSNDPVPGATVAVNVTAGPAGEPAVYEEELTGVTNGSGQAWFEPTTCAERNTPRDFVFTFTVLAVAKVVMNGDVVVKTMLYSPDNNECSTTEHVYEGVPGWWCDYGPSPFTPDPAAFTSGSPFTSFRAQTGTYYHVMEAVEAQQAGGCIEYRFACVDDPNLDSGWRNAESVAGATYPNGQPQTPHRYWAAPGGPMPGYRWTVQYRACGCETVGTPSDPKQVQ